jgi:hypothetical protein
METMSNAMSKHGRIGALVVTLGVLAALTGCSRATEKNAAQAGQAVGSTAVSASRDLERSASVADEELGRVGAQVDEAVEDVVRPHEEPRPAAPIEARPDTEAAAARAEAEAEQREEEAREARAQAHRARVEARATGEHPHH